MTNILKTFTSFTLLIAASGLNAETGSVSSDDRPSDAMIAPLVTLDTRLPITVSYENKKDQFNDNIQLQAAAKIKSAVESKAFPWTTLIALCAVAFAALLILVLPGENKGEKDEKEEIEKQKMKIKNILRTLSAYAPQTPDDARAYFIKVEESLKQLLNAEYALNPFTRTSQELSYDIDQLKDLPPSLKQQLIAIFETNDKIKFAKYQPAANDFAAAAETAKQAGNLNSQSP